MTKVRQVILDTIKKLEIAEERAKLSIKAQSIQLLWLTSAIKTLQETADDIKEK